MQSPDSTRQHRLRSKKPRARNGLPLLELLRSETPQTSNYGRYHMLVPQNTEQSRLYSSGSFISTGQLSIEPEGATNVCWKRKWSNLPSSEPCELQYQLARQGLLTDAVQTQASREQPTASSLDLRPAPQDETPNTYHYQSQEPLIRQSIHSRENPLLLFFPAKQAHVKLTPTALLLYP